MFDRKQGGMVTGLAWSPDGRRLATAGLGFGRVLDAATGRVVLTLNEAGPKPHNPLGPFSVAWSPDGSRLVTGDYEGVARVWDAATGRLLRTWAAHGDFIYSLAFAPDGARFASASLDRGVK